MRNYQILDAALIAPDNVLLLSNSENNPEKPGVALSHEGAFVSVSASFGPLEIALRLPHDTLMRRFEELQPVPGLATTIQVGTANAYISLGLTNDGNLVMRPTIVGDASGHLSINLVVTSEVHNTLQKWLSP